MGLDAFLDIGGVARIERSIRTLQDIHIGLTFHSRSPESHPYNPRYLDGQKREANFEAGKGNISDGFDQKHIGLFSWFGIDRLDALGSQIVAAEVSLGCQRSGRGDGPWPGDHWS